METKVAVETPFGPIWFWTRDTGRPVVLYISGAFAPADNALNLQDFIVSADVWRAHLPGNHGPPLIGVSLGLFVAAFDAAIRKTLAGRPMVLVGNSTGALVAMGVKASNLRRLVLIEPPLRITPGGPFESLRERCPRDAASFIGELFGLQAHASEPKDYSHLLAGLDRPARVIVGAERSPDTPFGESVVDDLSRAELARHPLVRLQEVAGAGHQVLPVAALAVINVINEVCAEAFG